MPKKKSAQEELSLIDKLQEDLNKRKAEAKRLLKEEEEKEAVALAKKLIKTYKTTDLVEIKQRIREEEGLESPSPSISEADLTYLQELANMIRTKGSGFTQSQWPAVANEIKDRF